MSERKIHMNFKKVFASLLAIMLLFSMSAGAKSLELTIGSESLYVSDGTVSGSVLDSPAYIENGRTMVPLRVISENLGAEVLWDGATQTVTLKSGSTEIKLTINSYTAFVNGTKYTMDAAPVISNAGRTMVPIRFITENFGKNVEYIAPTAQILISDEKALAEIAGRPLTIDDYKFLAMYIQVPYNAPDYVAYLNSFAEEVMLLAAKAKAEGVEPNPEIAQQLIGEVLDNSDIVYSETLLASAVKFVIDYAYAITYANSLEFNNVQAEADAYYKENYVRAKHILILTTDAKTGAPLSSYEKSAAKEKAEYILKQLKNGGDFDKLMNEHNQDPGVSQSPDGYVFTKGEMVAPFENAAFALKVGEVSPIVETDYGYHIIKRLALPEMDDSIAYSVSMKLGNQEYVKFFEDLRSKSTITYNMTNEAILQLLTK